MNGRNAVPPDSGGVEALAPSSRGPRYSYHPPSTEGCHDPPSGQFQAWAPVQTAGEVLSKRWKTVILWLLGRHRRRYGELAARIPGVTPKVLTEQLRELERDGLVKRSEVRGGARHVEYALTTIGEALKPIVEQLHEWGRDYLAAQRDSSEHEAVKHREAAHVARKLEG